MRAFVSWTPRITLLRVAAVVLGMVLFAAPASAQTGTIEGRVTHAATGEPLAGAQIAVVGTTMGVRTDDDGRFVLLNVPAGRKQIRVLLIGFTMGTLDLAVIAGSVTTANVELNTSVLRLDEIVVTGTGGQARRREVGNSIAQIRVADVIDPPQNVDQLLQARSPGVTVMQGNGMAGGGAQIRLRGAVSTAMSNAPLIYIDGIRMKSDGYFKNTPAIGYSGRSGNISASPLNDINPADIERIEVIKGAAATTLYGTDAAAGVIQIFTKRGRSGTPRWTVQVDQGLAHLLPFGTDINPYLNLKPCNQGVTCWDGWTSSEVTSQCIDEDSGPQCSWLRNAYRQKYSVSVSGGSDQVGYFVSGAYEDNDGVLPLDNETKIMTRGNFNFDLSDYVRVDVNTSYTNNNIRNTPAGNNAHGLTLNVYRANRNYVQSNDPDKIRPLLNQEITTEIHRIVTGTTVNYTPFSQFTNRFTIGYDYANQENRNLRPFGFSRFPGGVLSDQQIKFTTLTGDYVGNLNFDIGENLASTLSFGGQSVSVETIQTMAYGDNFPGPGVPTVSNASTFAARESRVRVVTAGFFVQNLLAFKDRYFVTAGLRVDGNSAFGKSLGLEAYPKLSVSYVISDEDFFPESMGEMKLRAAYGYAGRAPGAFAAIRTWTPVASNFQPAFTPDNIGNDSLGPERTREIEFGVEWAFLDNRLSTEFTWYEQTTTDALLNVRQTPSAGFTSSQLFNVGVLRNRGIELSANAILIDQADFGLDIGANIFTNHSLVIDLGGATPFSAGGGWVEEGFPVMALIGKPVRNRDEIAPPDTACVVDVDCAADFQTIVGPQQPTTTIVGSVSLRLPKGIMLSARGEYQGGAWISDGASSNALQRSVKWATCSNAFDAIAAGATESQLTAWERIACIPANHVSQIHRYKQDFFKLRDVTARIPVASVLPRVNSAFLTVTAQNWVRWINDDLRLFDPEMSGNGGRTRAGFDDQNRSISEHIPPPAIMTVSLRIAF